MSLHDKYRSCCEAVYSAIEDGDLKLNDWESDFFENIYARIMNGHDLSWKQSKKLGDLYGKLE